MISSNALLPTSCGIVNAYRPTECTGPICLMVHLQSPLLDDKHQFKAFTVQQPRSKYFLQRDQTLDKITSLRTAFLMYVFFNSNKGDRFRIFCVLIKMSLNQIRLFNLFFLKLIVHLFRHHSTVSGFAGL